MESNKIKVTSFVHLDNDGPDLYAALAKFQGECPEVNHNASGWKGNYTFADLGEIIQMTKEYTSKNGLSVTNFISFAEIDNKLQRTIVTVLAHQSGQKIVTESILSVSSMSGQNEHQEQGTAITYNRRYLYLAVLGIITEKEDNLDKKDPSETGSMNKNNKAGSMNKNNKEDVEWYNVLTKSGQDTAHFKKIKKAWKEGHQWYENINSANDLEIKLKDSKGENIRINNKGKEAINNFMKANPYVKGRK